MNSAMQESGERGAPGQSDTAVGAGAARTSHADLRAALVDAIAGVVERDRFLQRMVGLVAEVTARPLVALYTGSSGGALQLRSSSQPGATPAPARIALESDSVVEIMASPEHSALVAPLVAREGPFGALLVFSEAGGRFSAQDRRQLAAIAAEIAPTVAVAEQHHVVKQASVIDQLTGAHTAWYLSQRLDEELARAQRAAGAVTVLLVGVLGFEEWHNQLDYADLEALLRELAGALEAATRIFDIVAYQGAGAFAVVLPETERDAAEVVVERVRAQVRRQLARFTFAGSSESPTLSIVTGLAAFPQDGDRGAALMLAAEHRLDESRRQQRAAGA
jgi:diguanylate cyclase (GGDEF)-like protein